MFYPNTPRPTTQPLIATWNQDLGFNLKGSPILGNELTITLKGLTAETSYWLYVKPYIPLGNGQILIVPDESSITAFEVLTGGGETEKDVVIQLVESQSAFRVGQEYLIALRNGEQEKLQIRFLISQNAILNKTGTVVKNFPSEDWTVSGFALSTTNNKVVDQKAFENDEPLISNYVNGKIVNADLDGNTSFDNLEGRVSTNEDNKMDKTQNLNDVASKSLSRDNLEVYSKTEVETKDTNTLTSANNYTDQEVSDLDNELHPVAKSGDYNQLNNKPDLTVLEEVLVFPDPANFPATGETQKVYIAEDTGFMYRWSGSAYIQLTDQTAIWGKISGTLSNQTDLQTALQTALNGKVSKTGDETINGVKTFSSPVGVASPEDDGDAVNRLYTSNMQAKVITDTVILFKQKVESQGLVLEDWRLQFLICELEAILKTMGIIPNLFISRIVSYYPDQPTKLFNLGASSLGFVTVNGTLTNFYDAPDSFTFNGTDNWLAPSLPIQDTGATLMTHFNRSGTSRMFLWASNNETTNAIQTNLINNRVSAIQAGQGTFTTTQTYADNTDSFAFARINGTNGNLRLSANTGDFELFTINNIPTAGRAWQFGVRGTNIEFYQGRVKRLAIFNSLLENSNTKLYSQLANKTLI